MNFEERGYEQIPFTGFSADYVYREAKRAMDGAAGTKTHIWPGIDIDIPTGGQPEQEHAAGHQGRGARGLPRGRARRAAVAQVFRNEAGEPERRGRSDQAVGVRIDDAPRALRGRSPSRPVPPQRKPAPQCRGTGARIAGARPTSPRRIRCATTSPGGAATGSGRDVQGVIINAGGIVAYYPSKFPLQHRAEFLGDRDLYGELAKAAHDGRPGGAGAHGFQPRRRRLLQAASRTGSPSMPAAQPYRAADKYVTCVNSPYYDEYMPGVLDARSSSAAIPKASPTTVGAAWAATASATATTARASSAQRPASRFPTKHDWDDPVYREWIRWNYARRLEIWDLNNRATKRRRRAGLPVDRHERRIDCRPEPRVPRLPGDLPARRDHHARPPGAIGRRRLPAERRDRQADPRPARAGTS